MPRFAVTNSDMKADATFARLKHIVILFNTSTNDFQAGAELLRCLSSTEKALTALFPSLYSVKTGIKRYS
jgi:hypothetical protein